jgi:hypothetical protein
VGASRDDGVGACCDERNTLNSKKIRSVPPPALPRKREREENYTDAVVTPPSTTMVWPVMKLEASEPR